LWSYEVGAKDSFFNGRLGMQASAYYIDWSNIQTSISLPSCGQNYTGNRGDVVVKGVELQLEALPFEGFKVGASVGYTDAYYPESLYGASVGGVPPLLVGAGDKLPVVLPWTAAARAEYSWAIGSLWNGARSYVRADYRWQDGVEPGNPLVASFNTFNNQFRDEAFSMLNVRVGVVHDSIEVSAFVNNATREDPRLSFSNVGQRSPTYPLAYQMAVRPLTAGFTLMYRF
jgi:outer membrane receptor protein involved in Fe transport